LTGRGSCVYDINVLYFIDTQLIDFCYSWYII
jgi:hypothetical protein